MSEAVEIWHWGEAPNIRYGNTGIKSGRYLYTFSYDEEGLKHGRAVKAFTYPFSSVKYEQKPGSIFWGGYVGVVRVETELASARRFLHDTDYGEDPTLYKLDADRIIQGPKMPRATVFNIPISGSQKRKITERLGQIMRISPEYSAKKRQFCTTMVHDVLAFAEVHELAGLDITRPTRYADGLRELARTGELPIKIDEKRIGILKGEKSESWISI